MRQRIEQKGHNPVHCCVCINRGHLTAGTWIVTPTNGIVANLVACNAHVDMVERHGLHSVKPPEKGKRQPL